ncbi:MULTISPECIES: hypothetical protein [unclassified Glutamicibacter]|uniref:hypothetical protein n=1 Tax=unclassified Glutamicibacter TaxID=2627139 RepID=UPI001596D241|nr:hypothetical protein [Glutamicibacter sp. BW80]
MSDCPDPMVELWLSQRVIPAQDFARLSAPELNDFHDDDYPLPVSGDATATYKEK